VSNLDAKIQLKQKETGLHLSLFVILQIL
jgi:hypothetical protein